MTEEKAKEVILCLLREYVEQTANATQVPFHVAAAAAYGTKGADRFVLRGDAETNKEYVQVIPYIVIVQNGKILSYKRGTSGGEERLHNKYSIGLGGHISAGDCVQAAVFSCRGMRGTGADTPHMQCAMRELYEELSIKPAEGTTPENPVMKDLCWFYDDSNEVSTYHVCMCLVLELPENLGVSAKEDSVKQLEWYTPEELTSSNFPGELESWSKIALGAVMAWLDDPSAEKTYNKPTEDEAVTEDEPEATESKD